MNKVYILCGKIASGKTTYANRLCRSKHAITLSVDDVMLHLYDGCLGPQRHQEVMQRITAYFFTLIPQVFALGNSVVLDYGYWTKEERDWIKAKCREANIAFELHYLEIAEQTRLARLAKRNMINQEQAKRTYIIQDELQKQLDARFEIPMVNEYDIKISDFTINSNSF